VHIKQKDIQRIIVNICASNLESSKEFYTSLFEFEVAFDSNWFIHLTCKNTSLEIGLIDQDHELVPKSFSGRSNGFYLTIVVANVDDLYNEIKSTQIPVIEKPKDTFYGQRRMLITDPDGTLIDVSSVITG
jgi:predicted enzyme related to lactoylglutathione lyase